MHCIFCGSSETDVIETRVPENGLTVRRRRECGKCVKRFTTYEKVEELPLIVIKRDGRRERFDRQKLFKGIFKSTEKTTVTLEQVEAIVSGVESDLKQQESTEIESKTIGNLVAKRLKSLDKVAYIRFASVFRRFVDLEDFEKELKKLL
ncbi:transcriptional regulator NrdR [Candidatus Roizmanbacteria bacterium RIFCSPHIGHO2_02_FULL_37_13b]|uniref:Transcriptional repressor NrdR n=1 Tax=Candidatus Roizmanbacteria bacterium RIFCSPLOWO2_02_FULL_36_11 TaxID=1802071 RepID=A0A1F7JH76_9BACT|nr:MAG: transcriptional regulator NrdR [Candidatus Roizmanbacteria bacterium RIFCSPHIGHO2_02_FULL_37_13b]OGK54936.1 MAG: transcriptional regulator NrdR [Candidatus Roizmanbacteria bacterium RIFCSPLOWO2_02_FULL_36_11]